MQLNGVLISIGETSFFLLIFHFFPFILWRETKAKLCTGARPQQKIAFSRLDDQQLSRKDGTWMDRKRTWDIENYLAMETRVGYAQMLTPGAIMYNCYNQNKWNWD